MTKNRNASPPRGRAIRIQGTKILRGDREIVLKGINLGNWLNLEDFMMGLPGTDLQMRFFFAEQFGPAVAEEFFRRLEESFITENDIRFLAGLGFNLVRLPLNYRRFESDARPGEYLEDGFRPVDRLMEWCHAHGLMVMLDLHAAQGCQNVTPPSDNVTGYAMLWVVKDFQDRCVALWEALAARYKDHPALFGYNLLNEPITSQHSVIPSAEQEAAMVALHRRLCAAIRRIDPVSPLVIEGTVRAAGDSFSLDAELFSDPQTIASYHHYPCLSFAMMPELNLAGESPGADRRGPVTRATFEKAIAGEIEWMRRLDRPMFLGEFGLFSPDSALYKNAGLGFDEDLQSDIVRVQLETNRAHGIHWALWSYKDVGVMGLVAPGKETPWRTFVEDAGMVATREEVARRHAETFEFANRAYGKTPACASVFDACWNDGLRGLRRAAMLHAMEKLAVHPVGDILRMPESFLLENCRPAERSLATLHTFLQEGAPHLP